MAIISILILWMTVYLWNSGDRAKSIEAEWCANALWWALSNYVFYTLTSKNIRVTPDGDPIPPTYYYISLTGGNSTAEKKCIPTNIWSGHFCNKILLQYATWYHDPILWDPTHYLYKEVTVNNTCRHGKPEIWFYRDAWDLSWNIDYISMNKWFTPREVNAERVFYLHDVDWIELGEDKEKLLTWDIIVVLCEDESCNWWKQIGKRQVDARSQTISFKRCVYYKSGEEWHMCKTWEDCRVYDSDDPTLCKEY